MNMKTNPAKIRLFFKNIENGAVGICLEILMALSFILTGLVVCWLWWRIYR